MSEVTSPVTGASLGITAGSFDEIPKRIRQGGGGRTSEFLDVIRGILAKGKSATVPVEFRPLKDEDGEPILVNGEPQMESFVNASKRMTQRLYRPGALNFNFSIRNNPEDNTFTVFPIQEDESNEGSSENA